MTELQSPSGLAHARNYGCTKGIESRYGSPGNHADQLQARVHHMLIADSGSISSEEVVSRLKQKKRFHIGTIYY